MDDLDAVVSQLLGRRLQPDETPIRDGPGVYALFLSNRDALAVTVGDFDTLYIGMTTKNSKARSHFNGNSSGSSPRRSLGALLKEELHLNAYSRGRGRTPQDVEKYHFEKTEEIALTAWMKKHLTYSYVALSSEPHRTEIKRIEKSLAGYLKSPLNIDDDWNNPDQLQIKLLRKRCREEARFRKASGA